MIRLFVGFDQREAVTYHVFCQSVIDHASEPVAFYPLARQMLGAFDSDGSNAFTISRYLVPSLCDYAGWALFMDGDMVMEADIAELWAWKNTHADKAVAVVKHDYKTSNPRKYLGSTLESPNVNYPRKNWSSVVLWNCAHPKHRLLTADYIKATTPTVLHRFGWLADEDVGALSPDWNYLVGEYPPSSAHLYHHTLGIPGLRHYADTYGSWKWHSALLRSLECAGETPSTVVKRAQERIGEPEKIRAVR